MTVYKPGNAICVASFGSFLALALQIGAPFYLTAGNIKTPAATAAEASPELENGGAHGKSPVKAEAEATLGAAHGEVALNGSIDSSEDSQALVWQVEESSPGLFRVLKGSQFRVRLDQELTSDESHDGQPVAASLVDELKAGPVVLGRAGAQVLGIVNDVSHSRRTIKAYLPGKHWLDAQGRIGFNFSGIVDPSSNLIKIDAVPSEKTSVNQVKKTRAQLVANKDGEYVVKYAVGKYAAMDLAIGTIGLATGPVGILTSALVSGVAGSASKNYAAGRPVEDDEQFSKKKGFVMGVGRGLPGGAIIQGVATSGKDLELHKGDILTVSLREDLEVLEKRPHGR